MSRYTGTEDLVFKIRKNLFETLTFVARKPQAAQASDARYCRRLAITAVILALLASGIDMGASAHAIAAIDLRYLARRARRSSPSIAA